jgi:hypothetical protein
LEKVHRKTIIFKDGNFGKVAKNAKTFMIEKSGSILNRLGPFVTFGKLNTLEAKDKNASKWTSHSWERTWKKLFCGFKTLFFWIGIPFFL